MTLPANNSEIIEAVIARGDLARLTPDERSQYYVRVCESVGLNPMTKPLEYISLNGRLVLYARKDCTDQLRALHKVSVVDMTHSERDGVHIVTCKVANADGRTDVATGAVFLGGLKGEVLANALMKAETKSKRRATLSICGLGFLDETEVEDIPAEAKKPPMKTLPKKDARPTYTALQAELDDRDSCDGLEAWGKAAGERIKFLPDDWQDILRMRYQERLLKLRAEEGGTTADITDRVVWDDDGERPATEDDGIPPFLDRRPKKANGHPIVTADDEAW